MYMYYNHSEGTCNLQISPERFYTSPTIMGGGEGGLTLTGLLDT